MCLILCPSARLARSIKNDIAQQHMLAGKTQWPSANVQTLTQWLDGQIEVALLSNAISNPQTLLSPLNEQLLWQQVIQQSLQKNAFGTLFNVAGLAEAAMQANQYMIAWRLHIPREQQSEETRQFVQWQRAFQARCKALNVLENVRYVDWQLDVIKTNALQGNIYAASSPANTPSRIEFAGFDQTNPQEQRLREILQGQGFEVAEYASKNPQAAQTQHIALENQDAECRAAVAWAKQKLEENSSAKLAIVSPQLSETRNQLADLLDDVFYPASVNPSEFEAPRNYNFSLGTPLNQQAIIQAALNLLRLFSGYQLQQTDVSAALLSPFWSSSIQESDARAILDAKIREYLPMQFRLAQLIDFIEFQRTKGLQLSGLLAHINSAQTLLSNKKQAASAWANTLAEILNALHWPGERTLTSTEYQAKTAWQKALASLKNLDVLDSSFYQAEAVQILQNICVNQVFQPESVGEASIQILGIMEALSAPVDAMWCMGFNDHIWPPPARPNPLLPAAVQRAAKLPNADNSVQAAFANTVQQRLLHSASEIVFSSSLIEGSSQLRASPLLNGIPILQYANLAETLAETLSKTDKQNLEYLHDYMAPPLQAGEKIRGGSQLFEAQAICPAWAFYQYRLGATKLEEPSEGLDNITRGNLVHAILQHFWLTCKDLNTLKNLAIDALEAMIDAAIGQAIAQELNENLPAQILNIERRRLQQLLQTWLALEMQRDDFEIFACEAQHTLIIEGLEIVCRIDRIDAVNNGDLIIIDYKTGTTLPALKSWTEARISEPQLPLYAALALQGERVVAACFAKVHVDECKFSGVADEVILPSVTAFSKLRNDSVFKQFEHMPDLISHWQDSLNKIAIEIKMGVAGVIFTDENDLMYCDVKPLLRLPERELQFEQQVSNDE